MGCLGQDKRWTGVRGSPLQEGQRGLGLVLSSHDRKGKSSRGGKFEVNLPSLTGLPFPSTFQPLVVPYWCMRRRSLDYLDRETFILRNDLMAVLKLIVGETQGIPL